MARDYYADGIVTSKESAGLKNLSPEILAEYKDEESGALLAMIAPIFKKSIGSPKQNMPFAWKPDDLREELGNYFTYFAEHGLKPSKSSIRLWLNVNKDTYNQWARERTKFGEISDIINMANDVLETQYINRGEKHPTMNTFLLKSSHGHNDTQRIEINATNSVNREDIDSTIRKMKLEEDIMEIDTENIIHQEIE